MLPTKETVNMSVGQTVTTGAGSVAPTVGDNIAPSDGDNVPPNAGGDNVPPTAENNVVPIAGDNIASAVGDSVAPAAIAPEVALEAGDSFGVGAPVAVEVTAGTVSAQLHHPSYESMVKEALQVMKEAEGSTRSTILDYIVKNYELRENLAVARARMNIELKRLVASGTLIQMSGTGVSGSFRLAVAKTEQVEKAEKPVAEKIAAADNAEKQTAKKPVKAKSAATKTRARAKTSKPRTAPEKKAATAASSARRGVKAKRGRKTDGNASVKKTTRTTSASPSKTGEKPAEEDRDKSEKNSTA